MSRIFVINPGSTSTRVALFDGLEEVFDCELQHPKDALAACGSVNDQEGLRRQAIEDVLQEHGANPDTVDAIAGRGGLLAPLSGGVYKVSDKMLDDLKAHKYGEHPCNLGAALARDFSDEWGVPAYIADSVVTDELIDEARMTGMPEIKRRSVFHALNQRGAARVVADRLGIDYEHASFVVVHMGGGMSIGAHCMGRVVDVTNGLDGEGPFTPERTGCLPVLPVLEAMHAGRDFESFRLTVLREGGVFAHLGTNDMLEVERRSEAGEPRFRAVMDALAYNVAKHVGSMVPAAVGGQERSLDAVILTGGLARCKPLVKDIERLVSCFAAPVEVVPGSVEMEALARSVGLVLDGHAEAGDYAG